MSYRIPKLFLGLAILALYSCGVKKYIPEGQFLYSGAEIQVIPDKGVNKKEVAKDLKQFTKPKPNGKIFGMRPKLWLYFKTGADTPKKGFSKWLNKKFSEKPVYLSATHPEKITDELNNRMTNKGYFKSISNYQEKTDEKKKEGKILYIVKAKPRYKINQISMPQGGDSLSMYVRNIMGKKSLLKTNEGYDMELFKSERSRIDQALKTKGYFYFNPDFILFKVDTTLGNKTFNIEATIKDGVAPQGLKQYRLKDVFILTNYSLEKDSVLKNAYAEKKEGYFFVNDDKQFRPKAITNNVMISSGNIYNREKQFSTLSRLMGMGCFKYVNLKYFPDTANKKDSIPNMDAVIYLTPMKKKSIRAELQGISKSNNYAGPYLTLSYRDRNLFKGSEFLSVNLTAGFESQFFKGSTGLSSYDLGASSELLLPRFITPFKLKQTAGKFIPKTKIAAGMRFLNRVDFYNMTSANFDFGYRWKETSQKEHDFNPIAINLVNLNKASQRFTDLLEKNPFLNKSFREQFILGSNYTFTYNNLLQKDHRNNFYFMGNVDISGNLAYSIERFGQGKSDIPYTLFGRTFAQYGKFSVDGRHYFNFISGSMIATRLLAGVGLPYGNSSILPYVKQFFSGGANSIRAFRARTVGPGTFRDTSTGFFKDEAGDIKLEGNVEYRFGIISVVKGALFMDAGNVWLTHDDPQKPGSKFNINTFYRELAVGSGFGLRFDITFAVIRLDLAFPLRVPWNDGDKWIANKIRPVSPEWRSDNLILNVAIGYPF